MDDDTAMRINESLDLAKHLCPEYERGFVSYDYFNGSVGLKLDSEFPSVMCEVSRLILYGNNLNLWQAIIGFYLVPVGVLSCVLSLAILADKRCNQAAFIYHRALNWADLLCLMTVLDESIFNYFLTSGNGNYYWKWMQVYVTSYFQRVLSAFVESVIAWIAIERALCYFPVPFSFVNRPKFCYIWTSTLFLFNNIMMIPTQLQVHPAYNVEAHQWFTVPTPLSYTSGYRLYQSIYNGLMVFRAVGIVVGTVGTLCMLVLVGKKKRRMAKTVGCQSQAGVILLSQAKTNQILCLLQVSEALPIIVRCTMTLVLQTIRININFNMFAPMIYNEAWPLLLRLNYNLKLIFAKRVFDILVHGVHLFLYLIFLKRFRSIAASIIKNVVGALLANFNRSVAPSYD